MWNSFYRQSCSYIPVKLLIGCLAIQSCDSDHSPNENTFESTFTVSFQLTPIESARADLAFFIHDPKFILKNGNSLKISLIPSPWQHDDLALLKLSSKSNINDNSQLIGTLKDGFDYNEISQFRFTLGLPFSLNHANPLQALPPLNDSSMYWTWQQGYKFLNLNIENNPGELAFHLGSTQCSSPSALRPPTTPCRFPNRTQVTLPFDNSNINQRVKIDLSAIAALIETDSKVRCTGNYSNNPTCKTLYEYTGLDIQTGECINNCEQQTLFFPLKHASFKP